MNSQIHRVLNSTIFAVIPFACVRRELGDNRSVGSSREARNNSSAPFPIARHVLPTSQAGLSNADGGRHGVGTLRPFSRFSYVGQDTRCEKTYRIPFTGFQIPIFATGNPIIVADLRICLRSAAFHDSNRIGEFLSWVTNVLSRTTK